MTAYNAILNLPDPAMMKAYDAWGSEATYPHMSVAWSWAFDTPFKWTKQVASHFGGTRQGMVIAWPGHIKDAGGIRTQFHHMIDIVPTILETTGVTAPLSVNGIAQKPIEGVSMAYTLTRPTPRLRRGARLSTSRCSVIGPFTTTVGSRRRRRPLRVAHGNVKLPDVVDGYKWELYNLNDDLLGVQRSRGQESDKLRELKSCSWWRRRNTTCFRWTTRSSTARHAAAERDRRATLFTYSGEMAGIPVGDAPSILNKSYTITAEVEIPQGGSEGMLVTLGGRFGAYGLYVLKGKPVFTYNLVDLERFRWEGTAALTPGKHTIVFDFKYDGPGFGKGGTGVLKWTARTSPPSKSRTPFRSSWPSTRPSTSASTRARRWTTRTTRCRSPSPARCQADDQSGTGAVGGGRPSGHGRSPRRAKD
jgi:arylsulfatase